ncbi:MAG: hypothetical protein ACFHWX_12800 [Bacteroidota bacterium]
MRYASDFQERLTKFDFNTLEESVDTIYALNSNLEFIYFNPQYIKFAQENGFKGDILEKFPIGSSIGQVLKGDVLREFYLQNYQKSLSENVPWTFEYKCSTPSIFRAYQQRTYPIVESECIVILNSLIAERPIREVFTHDHEPNEEIYLQTNGLIYQCSNCRRTQQSKDSEKWDWVSKYIEKMSLKISHGICPLCFDYYWKYPSSRKIG